MTPQQPAASTASCQVLPSETPSPGTKMNEKTALLQTSFCSIEKRSFAFKDGLLFLNAVDNDHHGMNITSLHLFYACRPVLEHFSSYFDGNFLCCR